MASGNAIISFGCNDLRYKSGLNRMYKTLEEVGWSGGFHFEWIENFAPHLDKPYCFKTMKLNEYKDQYQDLLWLDTSMYAIKNPEHLFGVIDERGYYVSESGFNCAQSVSDACLEIFGISRDEAETIHEVSSGCVGLNMNSEIGRNILTLWKEYTDKGASRGSRFHDNQSQDKRFLFHRQDQSVLSLVLHKLGLKPTGMNEYWSYLSDKDISEKRELNKTVVFVCRGL